MNTSAPVLIVGAGPTGLFAACELSRHGIPVRIIDKKPMPTQTSNALGIQPRTMEIFDLVGIADRFLKWGHPGNQVNMFINGKRRLSVTLRYANSRYNYIFILPQNVTEKILNERLNELNVFVERSVELKNLTHHNDHVVAHIAHSDGRSEEMNCQWIVGCDGLHSAVRTNTHINFTGKDITQPFALTDASLYTDLPSDSMTVFFEKKHLAAFFPIEGDRYRVMGNISEKMNMNDINESFIANLIKERSNGKFSLKSTNWLSHFWIHSKVVNTMQENRVFIAGDAAHVHSPVGGQGMNTGLQDVFNLSWKLAAVIKGHQKKSLLESYSIERLPVIKSVVSMTDRMTRTMLSHNPLIMLLRTMLMKLFFFSRALQKKMSQRIAQLTICYEKSPVIDYKHFMSAKSPKPGERAPDVQLPHGRLYDALRNTKYNLLCFCGENPSESSNTFLLNEMKKIEEAFSNNLCAHLVSHKFLPGEKNIILDSDFSLHKRYGVKYPGLYVIRPDNVVAFCNSRLDFKNLRIFLEKYS